MSAARDNRERVLSFLAGGVGGAVGALATNPLDVVRTRFQARVKNEITQQAQNSRFATWSSLRLIAQHEGIRGLFRGLTPNLIAIVPARALYFSTYSTTKGLLMQYQNNRESWITHVLSAVAAGCVTSTVINPIWFIKVRLQLQSVNPAAIETHTHGRPYTGYADAFFRIAREEGVLAFYKGLSASLLGVGETVIQFVLYEQAKRILSERRGHKVSSPVDSLVLGGFSKLVAASLTYPHEVLRTRLREQRSNDGQPSKYTGLIQATRLILKEEGVRALYGGFAPHMMRVVPNTALIFGVYELVMRFGRSH